MKFRFPKYSYVFLLILLIITGGLLRFYNLNWDEGHLFHPDERNIALAVTRIHFFDKLNPEFFAYGSFPLYLYRAAADIMVILTKDPSWVSDWGKINLIGRFFSAFFSTLTIPFLFILTNIVFHNRRTALLASILYTFCVTSIQTAHFAITENLLLFFVVIIAISSINLMKNPNLVMYVKSGVILGLAVATKVSSITFAIYYGMAHLFNVMVNKKKAISANLFFLLLAVSAVLIFTVSSPYTFITRDKFMESMSYESQVARGSMQVVYTYQFKQTIPYIFQLLNFFWQIGPVFIFAVPGILLILIQSVKKKNYRFLLLSSFPFAYFLYFGSWHTKFIRYMIPVIPYFIIGASYFLIRTKEKYRYLGYFFIILSCVTSFAWALAFSTIYLREQTRITASKWIYTHIPPGSTIYGEHWDDGLPIPLPGYDLSRYNSEALTIYEPDNEIKLNYYADKLSTGDYVILSSRRLYGTLMRLDKEYPVTSKYYQLLFNNGLGYTKVAEFTSYPSLLNLSINDDSSEETFQVYDHPKVIIFKNENTYSYNEIIDILSK